MKEEIAALIKAARESSNNGRGMTQSATARSLGVARQTYLDLEAGKTMPRIDTLIDLARLFGRPVLYFLNIPSATDVVQEEIALADAAIQELVKEARLRVVTLDEQLSLIANTGKQNKTLLEALRI